MAACRRHPLFLHFWVASKERHKSRLFETAHSRIDESNH